MAKSVKRTGKPATRILIVDDHPIVQQGLSSLLSQEPDFEVCGATDDIPSAIKLVEKTKPHVVTIDISLASGSVLDTSVIVAANLPPVLFIQNGRYSLYDDGPDHLPGGGDDIALSPPGGWHYDGSTGDTSNFAVLAAGNYYFLVTGEATGLAGGQYLVSSSISPVPEPSIAALLLSSLCLMGFVARRRKVT